MNGSRKCRKCFGRLVVLLLGVVFASCAERRDNAQLRHFTAQKQAGEEPEGRSPFQRKLPVAKQQAVVMPTWGKWCEQERRDLKDQPPLCAMYWIKSFDEPMVDMLSNEPSRESPMPEKRIMLAIAVWPDGKAAWWRGSADKGRHFSDVRVEKSQMEGLLSSLKKLHVFKQPLNDTRHIYVDVGYWAIEVDDGGHRLHLESWDKNPSARGDDADFQRFCTVWRTIDTWLTERTAGWKKRTEQSSIRQKD